MSEKRFPFSLSLTSCLHPIQPPFCVGVSLTTRSVAHPHPSGGLHIVGMQMAYGLEAPLHTPTPATSVRPSLSCGPTNDCAISCTNSSRSLPCYLRPSTAVLCEGGRSGTGPTLPASTTSPSPNAIRMAPSLPRKPFQIPPHSDSHKSSWIWTRAFRALRPYYWVYFRPEKQSGVRSANHRTRGLDLSHTFFT